MYYNEKYFITMLQNTIIVFNNSLLKSKNFFSSYNECKGERERERER